MAVVNDELVNHVNVIKSFKLGLYRPSNALQSCGNYYRSNGESFLQNPCSEVRLGRDIHEEPIKANNAGELVAKNMESEKGITQRGGYGRGIRLHEFSFSFSFFSFFFPPSSDCQS